MRFLGIFLVSLTVTISHQEHISWSRSISWFNSIDYNQRTADALTIPLDRVCVRVLSETRDYWVQQGNLDKPHHQLGWADAAAVVEAATNNNKTANTNKSSIRELVVQEEKKVGGWIHVDMESEMFHGYRVKSSAELKWSWEWICKCCIIKIQYYYFLMFYTQWMAKERILKILSFKTGTEINSLYWHFLNYLKSILCV